LFFYLSSDHGPGQTLPKPYVLKDPYGLEKKQRNLSKTNVWEQKEAETLVKPRPGAQKETKS